MPGTATQAAGHLPTNHHLLVRDGDEIFRLDRADYFYTCLERVAARYSKPTFPSRLAPA
jgi:hypothetical protein